eukprot:614862-Rhodomonas_salina.1
MSVLGVLRGKAVLCLSAGACGRRKCVYAGKKSQIHGAVVVGDTVGDPLKDTSGPALNIVMKLMAIISVVFADFFMSINGGNGFLYAGDLKAM